MMNDLVVKAEAERKDEEVKMSAYGQWCTNTIRQKSESVEAAEQKMEELKANIQQNKVDIQRTTNEISGHDQDIEQWQGDQSAATKVREIENKDYKTITTDYTESLDALARAITTLRNREDDVAQALIQKISRSRMISKADRRHLLNLAAQEPFIDREAPKANAYEFQAGGVVDMLQKLKSQFQGELEAEQKKEMNSKHAYEQMMQELDGELKSSSAARERASVSKQRAAQALASNKGELAETTESRNDDRKYGEDTTAMCQGKKRAFQDRKKLREEEIAAIQKAIEIIGSPEVAGSAATHLPSLLQRSFLQVAVDATQWRGLAASLLRRSGSPALLELSGKVMKDPFKSVRKMVSEMIFNLKQEALAEAEHHGWCQAELKSNKVTRNGLSDAVESLSTDKEELTATILKTKQDTADLAAEVADLQASMAEATENRAAEKAKNAQTVKDAKAAQEAVLRALTILREFYEKAAAATALAQVGGPADDAPESFDPQAFTGNQGTSGGVVGMVEVIQSDFTRLESETVASETTAAKEYASFMQDGKVDLAVKSATITGNNEKVERLSVDLEQTKKDLNGSSSELDAAQKYFEELKPQCVIPPVSYEERVQKREDEIQSLKEALDILNSQDIDMA